jgi:hypothetical protein
VTCAAGARKADSLLNLTRFVRGRDAVPHLPPLSWKPGGKEIGSYAHFGREVLLDDSGFTCLEAHLTSPLDFSYWRDPVKLESLEDHRMAGYLERLEALLAKSVEESLFLPDGEEDGDADVEPEPDDTP